MNEIDNLKTIFEEYLTEKNLTAMKFAMIAQVNPISLYAWLNTEGYSIDDLSRAQIISYMNQNK